MGGKLLDVGNASSTKLNKNIPPNILRHPTETKHTDNAYISNKPLFIWIQNNSLDQSKTRHPLPDLTFNDITYLLSTL